jgi:lysyl endopeptidase
MKKTRIFRTIGFLVAVLIATISVKAQIQYGGRPITLDNKKVNWSTKVVTMPSVNAQQMMAEDELNNATKDIPYRFGKNFDVNYNLQNSGTWHKLSNGDRVWLLAIESPGAMSINLFFEDWYMPPGASFFRI